MKNGSDIESNGQFMKKKKKFFFFFFKEEIILISLMRFPLIHSHTQGKK